MKTVDSILKRFTKIVNDLEKVAETNEIIADGFRQESVTALEKAHIRNQEAERASKVAANMQRLLN